jgi:hypothetical protein
MPTSDRSEKILALLLLNNLKDASVKEKAVQLSLAGFSNLEIANLIGTTTGVVATLRSVARKSKRSTKKTAGRSRK